MIVIVDYNMGNVASVANMLARIGATDVQLSRDPDDVRRASKIILPGVGAFDRGMEHLEQYGLRDALDESVLTNGVPVLGICLGMQLLTDASEEGNKSGLGWIPGRARRFSFDAGGALKVPHMGWNYVAVKRDNPLIAPETRSRYYFVHSYFVTPERDEHVVATARYGNEFACAIARDNVWGVQFHPEKSHRFGMALLQNFVALEDNSLQAVGLHGDARLGYENLRAD